MHPIFRIVVAVFGGFFGLLLRLAPSIMLSAWLLPIDPWFAARNDIGCFPIFMILSQVICSAFSIVGTLLTGHHMNVVAEFRMARRELAEYQIKRVL